jgi:dolichyl-phosphate-mannose-protein mannosyltransferase
MVNYPHAGFWMKFKELHQRMWTANNELTESHPYQSRPSDWPMLRRGVSFWARDGRHIYFLGNPILYWSSTISIFTFLILSFIFKVRAHRHIKERFDRHRQAFFQASAGFYTMAWAFHYLPFYGMGRQLFLHHYLPALYCGLLVLGVVVDCILQKWKDPVGIVDSAKETSLTTKTTSLSSETNTVETKTTTTATTTTTILSTRPLYKLVFLRWMFTGLCVLVIGAIFCQYAPLTYGSDWDQRSCQEAQWLPLWEFDCGR